MPINYAQYFVDPRPYTNRLMEDYMQGQMKANDFRLANRRADQQDRSLGIQEQGLDLQRQRLGLAERGMNLEERLGENTLTEQGRKVIAEQLKFIANGLDGVLKSDNPGNAYQSFQNIVKRLATTKMPDGTTMLPPDYAKIPEKYEPEKIKQARDTLKAALGDTPEYGEPYAGQRGTLLQKNIKTGKVTPVVGAEGSQASPNRYSDVKTSTGIYRFDKTTGDISQLTDGQGAPILPVTADPTLEGQKTMAKETAKTQQERQAGYAKAQGAVQSLERQWDIVDTTIDEAIALASPFTTGFGSWGKAVPASPQKRLAEMLKTIKANVGFDKLQDMRANSPTGGALGQVSEMENLLLQATQGSMEQSLDTGTLVKNLQRIKDRLRDLRTDTKVRFDIDYGQYAPGAKTETGSGTSPSSKARFKILKVE